jgi:hypothetical protein
MKLTDQSWPPSREPWGLETRRAWHPTQRLELRVGGSAARRASAGPPTPRASLRRRSCTHLARAYSYQVIDSDNERTQWIGCGVSFGGGRGVFNF